MSDAIQLDEDSANQQCEVSDPKKRRLRVPLTGAGKVLFSMVVAVSLVGGAYAVVVLNHQLPTQTGPSLSVTLVSVGCTDLILTPGSILAGDGGGDVEFSCGNGHPALTTENGTASVSVTGLGSEFEPIPPGVYSPPFYLIPSGYDGPTGTGQHCAGIPNVWGSIDERHFGYPVTIGTGRWNYCLEYANQTSAGNMNPITVTWTAVTNWP